MGSCVLRETIRKGRPRFAPRVSLSIYLSIYLSYNLQTRPRARAIQHLSAARRPSEAEPRGWRKTPSHACDTPPRLCRGARAAVGSSPRQGEGHQQSCETTSSHGARLAVVGESKHHGARQSASEESVDGGSVPTRQSRLEARKGPERQTQPRQLQRASVQRVFPCRPCAECY